MNNRDRDRRKRIGSADYADWRRFEIRINPGMARASLSGLHLPENKNPAKAQRREERWWKKARRWGRRLDWLLPPASADRGVWGGKRLHRAGR
jgi:hypothetical protein